MALTGIPMIMADAVADLALPKIVILLIMILIFVLLGCVMDCFAIMILMVPILYPIIQLLAFDPIWFGVIMVIVLEVGLIILFPGIALYLPSKM